MSQAIPEPPPLGIRDNRGAALRSLRDRCGAIGLWTWRCDNAGAIVSEPLERGPLGLLFSSGAFREAMSAITIAWSKSETPEVAEVFPGAWAIPLPELRRRQRVGFTIGLAFSERALESAFFARACVSATLDATAIRRLLLPKARFDLASASAARDMLLWMGHDLLQIEEADHTIAGFTKQLSDCFETIDLLYSLGRSMNDLTQPASFVSGLCRRVQQTLSVGWVALWLTADERTPAGLGGGPGASGRFLGSENVAVRASLEHDLPGVLAGLESEPRFTILTELNGAPIPGSGQVLLHPVLRGGKIVGCVVAGDKHGDDPQVSSYDIQLLEAAAGYVGAFLDNAILYADQQALFIGTLEALTASIDAKDRYTCGHSRRVANLAQQLALAAGESPEDAERVRIAGMVHDVGKIGVPEAVLTKSGKLSDSEFDAIRKHPEIGHRILKDIPLLKDILPGVLYHHERWDGRGYPHKLAGEEIPKLARYISLADTFDAMSSNRSYRAAMPRSAVLAEVLKCAGAQFDPELARLFVTLDLSEYDRQVNADASAGPTDTSVVNTLRHAA